MDGVGKRVGNCNADGTRNPVFAGQCRQAPDVKGDFHEEVVDVGSVTICALVFRFPGPAIVDRDSVGIDIAWEAAVVLYLAWPGAHGLLAGDFNLPVDLNSMSVAAVGDRIRGPAFQVRRLYRPSVWLNAGSHGLPLDRADRRNRQNGLDHSGSVICFSSRNAAAVTANSHNILVRKALRIQCRVVTKGNIHPFAGVALLNQAGFSEANCTAATVKTGQTEQIVSRISSALVSGCYQQEALLPVTKKPGKY